MQLKEFFQRNNLKPTRWAEERNIAPSVISRYLNGKNISVRNIKKITQATKGAVSIEELLRL